MTKSNYLWRSFLRTWFLTLALTTFILVNLTACSHKQDNPLENQKPSVLITGGIVAIDPQLMERDSISYAAEILWTGWDADGIIDHYQYTIDVPDELLDKLNDPGDTGIAWVDTTAFRASFLFRTDEQDFDLDSPIERFRGDHTFYVRAVDNNGSVSTADYIAFTATNVTPKTTITVPSASTTVEVLIVGKQFNLAWEGTDPDNPDPARRPAYYEWKLKQMPPTWAPIGKDPQYSVEVNAADVPWTRISRDTTNLRLSLQNGFPYILAVRAVDEAGGVETKFLRGKNMLFLDSSFFAPGTPVLTVREKTQATYMFPGPIAEFEVAAGSCVRFEMTGDPSAYGGLIQGYNWGVDVDPDDDGPGSGFYGWSLNKRTEAICFQEEGIHTVVLKCRDTGGGVTEAVFLLRVIRFAFDRELLYVDDYRKANNVGILDEEHDRRNKDMLRAGGVPVDDPSLFGQINTFGSNDERVNPIIPRLSEVGAYKMIYWDVLGSGFNGNPALIAANACTGRILQAYVTAGGALWVAGQTVFAGFDRQNNAVCKANNAYEFNGGSDGLIFQPGDFVCEFMQICGGGFYSVRASSELHGLVRIEPTAKGTSLGFPRLEIDRAIWSLSTIAFTDAMFTPTFDATRGLDSLYIHRSPRTTSGMDRKPDAFRYHDPNVVPSQGPIAVFGFPIFLLQQGSASDSSGSFGVAKLMMDWFRSEQARFFATRGGLPVSHALPSNWAPRGKEIR